MPDVQTINHPRATTSTRAVSTGLGLLAILIWSTSFAVTRSVQENVGAVTGPAMIYTLGGLLGCIHMVFVRSGLQALQRLSFRYLLVCGGSLIVCTVCIELALGFARNRQQAVEVGIINYLWPGLTMLLSVPLLHRRARWFLLPAIALAFAGVVLALLHGGEFSWQTLAENFRLQPGPYILSLASAICWAVYSNMTCRLAGEHSGEAIPLFLLVCGLILQAIRLVWPEHSHWTARAVAEMSYTAVFAALLAYIFWDLAMRKGRATLVVAASYLTPLSATVITCLYLGVPMGWPLWLACAMVIVGAVLSHRAIIEPAPAAVAVSTTVSSESDQIDEESLACHDE